LGILASILVSFLCSTNRSSNTINTNITLETKMKSFKELTEGLLGAIGAQISPLGAYYGQKKPDAKKPQPESIKKSTPKPIQTKSPKPAKAPEPAKAEKPAPTKAQEPSSTNDDAAKLAKIRADKQRAAAAKAQAEMKANQAKADEMKTKVSSTTK
jgi:hypothetical protein